MKDEEQCEEVIELGGVTKCKIYHLPEDMDIKDQFSKVDTRNLKLWKIVKKKKQNRNLQYG
jgi:hypothetical protein